MIRGLAVAVFAVAACLWLAALGVALALLEPVAAAIWIVPSIVLWFRSAARFWRREWSAPVTWWLSTFAAPAVALVLVFDRFDRKERKTEMTVIARIEQAERQVAELQRELRALRALVQEPVAAPAPEPAPAPAPVRRWEAPVPAPTRSPRAPRTMPWDDLELADLLGARALAWAGGVVTLLGVVFFFALAVNRGWIGEVERVALGGLASVLVLAGGIVMRRRYGQLYSALGAAGAGIAGGFATLLAAAALYGLVPDLAALAVAAGIAAVGTWLALSWRAEMLAALGLVGATLVPLSVVFDGGLSVLGTGFAAVMFAATAFVCLRERWRWTLAAGFTASMFQIAVLVAQEAPEAALVPLVAVFVALYLGSGIAAWLRGLEREGSTGMLAAATLGAASAPALMHDPEQGWVLLALGVVYGFLSWSFFDRRRELAAVLAAPAMVVSALGLADLLGGTTLALVWALQAAALAWLARATSERRFQLAAGGYLVLAAAHAVAFEAPPVDLYRESGDPASGLPALLAVVLAALVFADRALGWRGGGLAWLAARTHEVRLGALVGAGVLTAYGAGLGALALVELTDVSRAFDWGHVAVVGVWAVAAATALALRRPQVGAVLAGATLVNFLLFDLVALGDEQSGWAAVAVAVPLLVGAHFALRELGLVLAAASAGLAAYAASALVGSQPERGLTYLGLGAGYALLAVPAFRRDRDRSTVLWASGLLLTLAGAPQLLDDTPLVVALAAVGIALSWLAGRVGERRLLAVGLGLAAGSLAVAFVDLAPPDELFVSNASPADGAFAILVAAAAVGAAGLLAHSVGVASDAFDAWLDETAPTLREAFAWAAGIAGVYGVSLAVLGSVLWLGGADVTTEFQRGHTAVSAVWGIVALAALYVGLRRRLPAIRLAGFALFGVSLAKIFLYDLSTLSSVTRALSFLAVGAVLLLAGFFYQRLSDVRTS